MTSPSHTKHRITARSTQERERAIRRLYSRTGLDDGWRLLLLFTVLYFLTISSISFGATVDDAVVTVAKNNEPVNWGHRQHGISFGSESAPEQTKPAGVGVPTIGTLKWGKPKQKKPQPSTVKTVIRPVYIGRNNPSNSTTVKQTINELKINPPAKADVPRKLRDDDVRQAQLVNPFRDRVAQNDLFGESPRVQTGDIGNDGGSDLNIDDLLGSDSDLPEPTVESDNEPLFEQPSSDLDMQDDLMQDDPGSLPPLDDLDLPPRAADDLDPGLPGDLLPGPARPSRPSRPTRPRRTEPEKIYNKRDCGNEAEQCQAKLARLASHPITEISLDISPSFSPDKDEQALIDEARREKLAGSGERVWRNRDGEVIAEGRFVDLRHGKVHVQTSGGITKISYNQLGSEEVCFVSAWWGMPSECLLASGPFDGRHWVPNTLAWKASGTCHKPLYFEERALERYGHASGPIVQPMLSAAHFFGGAVLLPYKMGINPPTECQYDLGLYRPGNCAPYMLDPIPFSIRAGLIQAGAVLGVLYTFP